MPIEWFNTSPLMQKGFIPLDISVARVVGSTAGEDWANATGAVGTPGGGLGSSLTAVKYQVTSTAARRAQLTFSSGSAAQVQFPPVVLPPDWSSLSSGTVKVLGGLVAGTTDTGPLFRMTGTLSSGSSGGTGTATHSVAVTLNTTVASVHTMALGSSELSVGYPNVLTLELGITSTQNAVYVCGAWIEYTRTLRG